MDKKALIALTSVAASRTIASIAVAFLLSTPALAQTQPALATSDGNGNGSGNGPVVMARMTKEEDPLEHFNRVVFSFNNAVLSYIINPTADYLGPRLSTPVKTGLSNVYSNLTEVEFILNNILIGAPLAASISVGRFAVNSTVGIGGLFDVASTIGLERRELDFIESLCHAGVPPGPYIVLPLVGSANLYSAAALISAVALEVYGLSFISTTLATIDFIVIDLAGSASSLRYMNTVPVAHGQDPYNALRTDHHKYIQQSCKPDRDANIMATAQ